MKLSPKNKLPTLPSLYYNPSAWYTLIFYLTGWGLDFADAIKEGGISAETCLAVAAALDAHRAELLPSHREWLKGHSQKWHALGQAGGCLIWDETVGPNRLRSADGSPVCPTCAMTITRLGFVRHDTILGTFDLKGGHDEDPFANESGTASYFCPECCGDLFTNEDDAAEFLNRAPQVKELHPILPLGE